MICFVCVMHTCVHVGLCALSADNENGFIAYPGSSQVSYVPTECI